MSIPDQFVIYYGEGMVSNGPDGAALKPTCPYVFKELAEPQFKSFQQVRRWIMEMFQLDEGRHRLALQHIVCVNYQPSAKPYNVLVDIIGNDSWRAYLNAQPRQVGSLKLYARLRVKETGFVSDALDGNSSMVADKEPAVTDGTAAHNRSREGCLRASGEQPAGGQASLNPGRPESGAQQPLPHLENQSDDGGWPNCKHSKPCTIETCWGHDDPGRRFYRCPLFAEPSKDCGFTQWLDKKFPGKATEHINYLLGSVDSLEQQVENLQNEVDELRRRLRKKSTVGPGDRCRLCNKSPCGCASRHSPPRRPTTATPNS